MRASVRFVRLVPVLVTLVALVSGCVFPWQRGDAPGATESPAVDGEVTGPGPAVDAPADDVLGSAGGAGAGEAPAAGEGPSAPASDPRGPTLPDEGGDAGACGLDASNADPPRVAPRLPEGDARPPPGVRERDALGALVVRVTDADALGRPGFVNEYAKASPWNADGSKLLLQSTDGYRALFDARGLVFLGYLPLPLGDVEPRWSVVDPDRLYFVFENRFCSLFVPGLDAQVVVEFAGYDRVTGSGEQDLLDLGGGKAAFAMLARVENAAGEADAMDLVIVSFNESEDGVLVRDQSIPKRVYDRSVSGDLKPDAIALTREFVVMSWSEPYAAEEALDRPIESVRVESGKGMSLFDWSGSLVRKLFRGTHEWDVCRNTRGEDVVVSWGANDNDPRDTVEGGNKLVMLGLAVPSRTVLFANDWFLSGHVSCRNTAKAGWAFVSSVDESNAIDRVAHENVRFAGKILAVGLDAEAPSVTLVAETRTQTFDSKGEQQYWREVHVVASRDGREVVWAANFGVRVDDPLYADTLLAVLAPFG